MQSIKLNTHVGSDGILHLDIPLGIIDKEIEVMVIYQERQRAEGRRQKEYCFLPSATTGGSKGLKPRRLYGADFFVGV
ncbi:hypothetical protein [Nostoc sp.]|uniref:hypothetical protein n=1 Tax=Nostoc sp. TaxID=1180 RepID=UPI002FF915D2